MAILTLIISISIALIQISNAAREECFHQIENSAEQVSAVFTQNLEQTQMELFLFGNILVQAGNWDSYDLMQSYMQQFVKTRNFAGVGILYRDGNSLAYGESSGMNIRKLSYEEEIKKVPYTDDLLFEGQTRSTQYVYQAVPLKEDGEEIGILYGYISLHTLATYIISTEYDGRSINYVIDADAGSYLVDEYNKYDENRDEVPLMSNLYDDNTYRRETKKGYNWDEMLEKFRNGEPSYIVFRSEKTGEWYYSYNHPVGINNWFVGITIDESTAFALYDRILKIMVSLISIVIAVAITMILLLWKQMRREHEIGVRDQLTGVGNRYALYEFENKLYKSQNFGVIFCDVTGLKSVNDIQGHHAGDRLLKRAADSFVAVFHKDQVFRIGGDEFFVICTDMTEQEMGEKIKKLQKIWNEGKMHIAIGYQWIENYSGDVNMLTPVAEEKMYRNKSEWYRKNGIERRRSGQA